MRLLPLTLSAHSSAWQAACWPGERQEAYSGSRQEAHPVALCVGGDPTACRFCGVLTSAQHEPFHLNGDHADNRPENLVYACTMCHLAQHLDDAETADAATLVWMPEISQASLIALARSTHAFLAGPCNASERRRASIPFQGAQRVLSALRDREKEARQILGTSRPMTLAAALLALEPAAYRARAHLLDGIRLLPTGRLMRGGHDVFPELLRQWREPEATSATRTAA